MAAQAVGYLETNIRCIDKVIFCVQNMETGAQHAQHSHVEITLHELTPT